eukprot:jgi/Bigna1/78322/fgenesh1_pg.54_\
MWGKRRDSKTRRQAGEKQIAFGEHQEVSLTGFWQHHFQKPKSHQATLLAMAETPPSKPLAQSQRPLSWDELWNSAPVEKPGFEHCEKHLEEQAKWMSDFDKIPMDENEELKKGHCEKKWDASTIVSALEKDKGNKKLHKCVRDVAHMCTNPQQMRDLLSGVGPPPAHSCYDNLREQFAEQCKVPTPVDESKMLGGLPKSTDKTCDEKSKKNESTDKTCDEKSKKNEVLTLTLGVTKLAKKGTIDKRHQTPQDTRQNGEEMHSCQSLDHSFFSTPLNLTKRLQGGADNGNQMQTLCDATSNLRVNDGDAKMTSICKKLNLQMEICDPNANLQSQVKQVENCKPQNFQKPAQIASNGVASQWHADLESVKKKIEKDAINTEQIRKSSCAQCGQERKKLDQMQKGSVRHFQCEAQLRATWNCMVTTFKSKRAEMEEALEDIDKTMQWLLPKMKEEELTTATREVMEFVEREMGHARQHRKGFATHVTQNGKRHWFQVGRQLQWKAITLDDCRNSHQKAFWGKSRFDDEEKEDDVDHDQLMASELEAE